MGNTMADDSLSKEGIDERAWHAVPSDEALGALGVDPETGSDGGDR